MPFFSLLSGRPRILISAIPLHLLLTFSSSILHRSPCGITQAIQFVVPYALQAPQLVIQRAPIPMSKAALHAGDIRDIYPLGEEVHQEVPGLLALLEVGCALATECEVLVCAVVGTRWHRRLVLLSLGRMACFCDSLVLIHQYACDLLRLVKVLGDGLFSLIWRLLEVRAAGRGSDLPLIKLHVRVPLRLVQPHFGNASPLIENL